jgi:hypothetical protein
VERTKWNNGFPGSLADAKEQKSCREIKPYILQSVTVLASWKQSTSVQREDDINF